MSFKKNMGLNLLLFFLMTTIHGFTFLISYLQERNDEMLVVRAEA